MNNSEKENSSMLKWVEDRAPLHPDPTFYCVEVGCFPYVESAKEVYIYFTNYEIIHKAIISAKEIKRFMSKKHKSHLILKYEEIGQIN